MENKTSNAEELISELNNLEDKSKKVRDIIAILWKLHNAGVELKEYIGTCLKKFTGAQDADELAKLVKALNDVGITGKKLENHVPTILGKLNDISVADELAKLVTALNDAGVDLTQKQYVANILDHFKTSIQSADDLADLVKALNDAGVDLTQKQYVTKILDKLDPFHGSIIGSIELVVMLKRNNNGIALPEDLLPSRLF